MVSLIYLFCAPILFSIVTTKENPKSILGYPVGYLTDCPGVMNPSLITKKSLNNLYIKVNGAKSKTLSVRKRFTYYQTREMAHYPAMDYERKTVFFITGYNDSPDSPPSRIMETTYRKLGYNVWLLGAYYFINREYPSVVRTLPTVAKHIAEMLYNITKENVGFDPKKLELVGLSLGGQTMSLVAKSYTKLSGMKIGRLTGLDPSGPCFRNLNSDNKLDKSDGDYVEVLSTNIDGLGTATPVGHVNFYVNGGEYQMSDVFSWPCEMFCSHVKVFTLWYSILLHPESFIAIKCDSVQQARDKNCFDRKPLVTNLVGLKVNKTNEGIFYLAITHNYPYYMSEKGLDRKYEPIAYELSKVNEKDVLIL
ncbi:pancreatic lipase-related protein 2-like [Aphomia sociella]